MTDLREILERYQDFGARTVTAIVLAIICLAGIWRGGLLFLVLCSLLVALLIYELLLLTEDDMPQWHRITVAVSSALAFALVTEALLLQYLFSILACIMLPVATSLFLGRSRLQFAIFGASIFLAANQLILIRTIFGFDYVLAVILTVVASDMAGYFIGRLVKGPRLPTSFSPNKTWSGSIAGWLAAIAVWCTATTTLSLSSLVMGFMIAIAAQLGDLAQSWLKRRANVKDSSSILPGHGGIYDRFDSMIGAGVLLLFVNLAGLLTA